MSSASSRPPAGLVGHEDVRAIARLSEEGAIDAIPVTVDAIAQRLLGHRCCSVNRVYADELEVERLYCSHPEWYPLSGRRPKRGRPWAEQVLVRGEVFIGSTPDDLREAFDEYEEHLARGLVSVINTPVLSAGRCIGTLNLLHEEGWYRAGDEELTRALAYLLLPFLLAVAS